MPFHRHKTKEGLVAEGWYEVFIKNGGYLDATKSDQEHWRSRAHPEKKRKSVSGSRISGTAISEKAASDAERMNPDSTQCCGVIFLSIPLTIRGDVDQDCKNRILWDVIWICGKQSGIDYKIKKLCPAAGIPPGTHFDTWPEFGAALKGKTLRVRVTRRIYNGQAEAQIAEYKPSLASAENNRRQSCDAHE